MRRVIDWVVGPVIIIILMFVCQHIKEIKQQQSLDPITKAIYYLHEVEKCNDAETRKNLFKHVRYYIDEAE